QASPADQLACSKLIGAEVAWQRHTRGQTFLEGIVAMPEYAEGLIRQRIEQDHPQSGLDIAQIEIHDIGVESLQLPIFSDDVLPFAEFVLTYRGGWPVGLIGARLRSGEAVPDWLNGAYVKNLVDELDVG